MIDAAYDGEDVPIRVLYEDTDGTAIDPDDTAVDPTVTITDSADTAHVSDVVMTSNGTGDFEHVWDTATNGSGTGEYTVTITADFSSETKISRDTITLR